MDMLPCHFGVHIKEVRLYLITTTTTTTKKQNQLTLTVLRYSIQLHIYNVHMVKFQFQFKVTTLVSFLSRWELFQILTSFSCKAFTATHLLASSFCVKPALTLYSSSRPEFFLIFRHVKMVLFNTWSICCITELRLMLARHQETQHYMWLHLIIRYLTLNPFSSWRPSSKFLLLLFIHLPNGFCSLIFTLCVYACSTRGTVQLQ